MESQCAYIKPCPNFWDARNEDYGNNPGNQPFYFFQLAKSVHPYFDVDAKYTVHSTFQYQKYQKTANTTTHGLGSKRNFF